jgi:exodeoxyribonuclease VII large subunit
LTGATLTAIPRQRLDRADSRLAGAMASHRDRQRLALARLANRLAQHAPHTLLARADQRLKSWDQRLQHSFALARERRSRRLAQAAQRLRTSLLAIGREQSRARLRLDQQAGLLRPAWQNALRARAEMADRHAKLLRSLGYRQVLSRGFALVRDAEGRPRRSALDIKSATVLDIEFADGHISAVTAEGATAPAKRSRAPRKSGQASLF